MEIAMIAMLMEWNTSIDTISCEILAAVSDLSYEQHKYVKDDKWWKELWKKQICAVNAMTADFLVPLVKY